MMKDKKHKICATGIFSCNIIRIDEDIIEWLDAKSFSLASLGKLIGIDEGNKVKATVTLEVVQGPCELCGNLTTGDKLCNKCDKMICDECAKINATGRYCPTCFELKKLPTTH